jgi:hypothetical protein
VIPNSKPGGRCATGRAGVTDCTTRPANAKSYPGSPPFGAMPRRAWPARAQSQSALVEHQLPSTRTLFALPG